jgi:di/tricarboxylate transporter
MPHAACLPASFPRIDFSVTGPRLRGGIAAAIAAASGAALWLGAPSLPLAARAALWIFALCIVAWTVLRLPETPVAIAGALALVGVGATSSERFYSALGHDLIWLMIGAFLLAAVVKASGLAERCVLRAVAGCASVRGLFYRLTWVIAATAFVIPSTSGRAALLLPVFLVLTQALGNPRLTRALALLFPTAILLSACASLLGAGAHLVAVDFIGELGAPKPDFLDWAMLGVPLALASSFAATETILRLFLTPAERRGAVALPASEAAPMRAQQRAVLWLTLATIAGWATSHWHGIDAALVALAAALAATCKALTGVSVKEALKGVEWNLILFLAATLVMGEALLASGAAQWLADGAAAALPQAVVAHPTSIALAVAVLAMLSHLVITSRSARATVLIPTLALPLAIAPEQAIGLIVLVTMASGFCQTFKVSAKPVALFATDERNGIADADLLRLSLALMPSFLLALAACAFGLWPAAGLSTDLGVYPLAQLPSE